MPVALVGGEDSGGQAVPIEFLSNLAHQLRSPLSSIRVWVDLLSEPGSLQDATSAMKMVSGIDRATDRLNRQISDIMDAASLQAGTLSFKTEQVEVAQQLVQAVSEIEHTARKRRITIDLMMNNPSARVIASAPRLRQMVGNLLSNAVRFSPVDRVISVNAGQYPRLARDVQSSTILKPVTDGQNLYICVSDSGPGIAPELHRAIFQPFQRLERKGAHGGGGSGLGLAILAGLLRLQGGGLWVKSRDGEGAEFEFALPEVSTTVELN